MGTKIPISEARKQLSALLKGLQDDPDAVYEITVNDIVFGELSAPKERRHRLGTGEALLRALEDLGEPKVDKGQRHSIARNHDAHLYPPIRK
jgi:hypothetical protein